MENIALHSLQLFYIVLRAGIVTAFGSKMVTIFTYNTKKHRILFFVWICLGQKLGYNASCPFAKGLLLPILKFIVYKT